MSNCFLLLISRISEVGTSNIFFFWKNEKGEKELVTPTLDEGYILPGVTRDCILVIIREEHAIIFFFI